MKNLDSEIKRLEEINKDLRKLEEEIAYQDGYFRGYLEGMRFGAGLYYNRIKKNGLGRK